jgi:hypothetical protein
MRAAAIAAAAGIAAVPSGGHHATSPAPGPPVVIAGAVGPPPPGVGPIAATRAFVAAFEELVYGRLDPAGLPHVSPYVRRQLAAQRPDPPAAVVAAAAPRLRSLVLSRRGAAARAVAVVADGPATYAIRLELARRHGDWTVTGLAEAG